MELTPLKTIVIGVLIAIFVGLIIFDIFLAINKEQGDTISEIIAFYSSKSLLIPAMAGILIGHFWWPNTWWDAPISIILIGFLFLFSVWLTFDIHMIISKGNVNYDGLLYIVHKYPIINVFFHASIGHLLWGQNI